jgi:hypothetical protein
MKTGPLGPVTLQAAERRKKSRGKNRRLDVNET